VRIDAGGADAGQAGRSACGGQESVINKIEEGLSQRRPLIKELTTDSFQVGGEKRLSTPPPAPPHGWGGEK
jgi:hypothetical protein